MKYSLLSHVNLNFLILTIYKKLKLNLTDIKSSKIIIYLYKILNLLI